MTISKFIEWVNLHSNLVIIYMIIVPVLALIATMVVGGINRKSSSRYLYSGLMHATCIPGVLAMILSGYTIGLQRGDILNVNVLVYFLPIISMGLTIGIINRTTRMAHIPGFKRLSGFMLMIAVAFVLVFILQRMFIGVLFFGTVQSLLLLFVALFVIIKIAWGRLAR